MTSDRPKKKTKPKGLPKTGGMQKGYKAPQTLAKEAAREAVRQRITARLTPIVDAQIDSAIGIKHFMLRNPESGLWERISDPDQIVKALNHPKAKQGSTYLIYTRDPNAKAASDMLAYAIDRPRDPVDIGVTEDAAQLIELLLAGRARAAKQTGKGE